MVLESTIVCLDNSEYSRNGDFPPSRFVSCPPLSAFPWRRRSVQFVSNQLTKVLKACQVDSVNMLCSAKVQSHAESSVGLLSLAGPSARILITSTRDLGRVFTCMHDVRLDGLADMVAGIQKAQLALKHRQNTLQRQRIVVFVSSPIAASTETLVRLGKSLKKNSVAVDVVNIGVESDNTAKVDAFIEAVNSNDNSHAVHVESGSNLAAALMDSQILHDQESGSSGMGSGLGVGAGTGDFGGMDAEAVDPELAMVLRISMEEERARQAAARQAEQAASGEGATSTSENPDREVASNDENRYEEDDGDLYGTGEQMDVDADDAEMLRRAIELSTAEAEAAAGASEESKDEDKKDG